MCTSCSPRPLGRTSNTLANCDFTGIICLIVGSCVPCVYYGFYTADFYRNLYMVTILISGALVVSASLLLRGEKWRAVRRCNGRCNGRCDGRCDGRYNGRRNGRCNGREVARGASPTFQLHIPTPHSNSTFQLHIPTPHSNSTFQLDIPTLS